jgi:hypothetical protein
MISLVTLSSVTIPFRTGHCETQSTYATVGPPETDSDRGTQVFTQYWAGSAYITVCPVGKAQSLPMVRNAWIRIVLETLTWKTIITLSTS